MADPNRISTSSVRRRVVRLERETTSIKRRTSRIERALARLAKVVRDVVARLIGCSCAEKADKVNRHSRSLSPSEADTFRRDMAAHDVEDETPDPNNARWN